MNISSNSEASANDSLGSKTSNDSMEVDNCAKNPAHKRSLEDDETSSVKKKLKVTDEGPRQPVIEALLSLHSAKNNNIDLQITYINGLKEAPQQLMQYLKNNLM